MTKRWFRAKRFGWGWHPSSWEGWLVMLGFIAIIIWDFIRITSLTPSLGATLSDFIPQALVLILILFFICHIKGEPARWRWGK